MSLRYFSPLRILVPRPQQGPPTQPPRRRPEQGQVLAPAPGLSKGRSLLCVRVTPAPPPSDPARKEPPAPLHARPKGGAPAPRFACGTSGAAAAAARAADGSVCGPETRQCARAARADSDIRVTGNISDIGRHYWYRLSANITDIGYRPISVISADISDIGQYH